MNLLLAAALRTCVIVYSPGTNGDWVEKYWHEMAHCNGWKHPDKGRVTGKAHQAPARFKHLYYGPIATPCGERPCTVPEAQRLCGGHFACQWFE